MAREKAKLVEALADLETRLIRRLAIAYERSPENFLDEAEALDLVIGCRESLQNSEFCPLQGTFPSNGKWVRT